MTTAEEAEEAEGGRRSDRPGRAGQLAGHRAGRRRRRMAAGTVVVVVVVVEDTGRMAAGEEGRAGNFRRIMTPGGGMMGFLMSKGQGPGSTDIMSRDGED